MTRSTRIGSRGGRPTPAVKWAVICALQASAHLSGASRSVELAAIGRRVCESEWDLFVLLGVAVAVPEPTPAAGPASPSPVVAPFGRPTAAEFVEAVREYLERDVMADGDGGARFTAVARNALQTVERQLDLGAAIAEAHVRRLASLGFEDDAAVGIGHSIGGLRRRLDRPRRGPGRRRPATSCWWPTRPTWRAPPRRGRSSADQAGDQPIRTGQGRIAVIEEHLGLGVAAQAVTSLSCAVASASGTSSIDVPCSATI